MAIRGDKILAVGGHPEVTALVGEGVESIDLQGKTLLPGLIDSHVHTIHGGLSLAGADVGDQLRSVDELVVFAAQAKKKQAGHARRYSLHQRNASCPVV